MCYIERNINAVLRISSRKSNGDKERQARNSGTHIRVWRQNCFKGVVTCGFGLVIALKIYNKLLLVYNYKQK